jgi:hypothetical protein
MTNMGSGGAGHLALLRIIIRERQEIHPPHHRPEFHAVYREFEAAL